MEEELLTVREGCFIKAMTHSNIFRNLRTREFADSEQSGAELEEILRGRMLHTVLVNLLRTDF